MVNEEQVALLEKALADMKGYAMQDEDRLYRIKPIDH
tara:strand:- start:248 stop:358 length:111 start_codon:yes stop_codon:yes gene_type:complete